MVAVDDLRRGIAVGIAVKVVEVRFYMVHGGIEEFFLHSDRGAGTLSGRDIRTQRQTQFVCRVLRGSRLSHVNRLKVRVSVLQIALNRKGRTHVIVL